MQPRHFTAIDPAFRSLIESLEPKLTVVLSMNPVRFDSLPSRMPQKGVYLLSEGSRHLYVGRTNRMRDRLREHALPSSSHYSATLAFRIARKATGLTVPSYKPEGSRAQLLQNPGFLRAFEDGKTSISNMDVRFVEEEVPIRQALLEIYIATVLKTPFNDFDTH